MTTAASDDGPEDGAEPSVRTHRDDGRRPPPVLRTTLARLGRDPALVVPFTVAGLLVGIADGLRRLDPVPAAASGVLRSGVHLSVGLVPSGAPRTVRTLGALVGLRPPYLLGAVGLELVVAVAVGVAGWATIARAAGAPRRRDALARYLALSIGATALAVVAGPGTVAVGSLPVGLLAIVVLLYVVARLLCVPAFLVAGRGYRAAIRESARTTRGQGWAAFGLLVVLGVGNWALAQVPVAGGALSTAAVAPVHAVALTVLVNRDGTERPSSDGGR